jgi:hypothetical protein
MRKLIAFVLLAGGCWAQQPADPRPSPQKLKTRPDPNAPPQSTEPHERKDLWVIPAGTRIPIQLRQPISTKGAQPGDPIYAQTSFPVVISGDMVIPAGTWVQGSVDSVKRAGRIKGTAELQFHLTTLIYANGYSVNMAAAIDQVPGDDSTHVKEPGTVQHNSEKGKDLERVGTGASQGGQIGAIAGAAGGNLHSFGVGGLSGIAAGTLIALLTRGSDVRFDTGTAVEIALSYPIAVESAKVLAPAR